MALPTCQYRPTSSTTGAIAAFTFYKLLRTPHFLTALSPLTPHACGRRDACSCPVSCSSAAALACLRGIVLSCSSLSLNLTPLSINSYGSARPLLCNSGERSRACIGMITKHPCSVGQWPSPGRAGNGAKTYFSSVFFGICAYASIVQGPGA